MASRFLVPFSSGRSLFGPSDPFFELHREMNRLFDDTFRGMQGGQSGGGGLPMMAPRMDIHSRDDALEITAELPGVTQNDIDLRVEGDVLTIRGEKRNERKDEQARIVERSYGSFQRSVQLPFTPDANQVQAHFNNGVLTITLPKTAQQEQSRRIEIGSGQGAKAGQQTIEGRSGSGESRSAETQAGSEGRPAIGGESWAGGESQGSTQESAEQRQDSDTAA